MEKKERSRGVKTTTTVFGIIDTLQKSDGATVTEVAKALDLAPSTVYEHLTTLEAEEYIVKEDGQYHLGLQFLDHGIHARDRLQVTHAAPSALVQLAEKTGELIWLIVEEQGRAVFLLKEMGDDAISVRARSGTRGYLHYLASGKAILAQYSDSRVTEILDQHGMYPATDNAITDREELFNQLEIIRDRGYAFMDGEVIEGLSGIGAPIVLDGTVHGAISVSGPKNRLSEAYLEEEILNELLSTTNEIELRLKSM